MNISEHRWSSEYKSQNIWKAEKQICDITFVQQQKEAILYS